MCRVLVTVKKASPTKHSSSAAPAVSPPVSLASKSSQLASVPAAHHRRLRHVFGFTAAGPLVSQAPRPDAHSGHLSRRSRPGIVSLHRSLASSHLSHPDQSPGSSHQPRLRASAHGPPAPPEPYHSRPPASPRLLGHRSSKTSLGFISTPLIWQGRKWPAGGRRPASTRAPSRPTWVHITKPAVLQNDLKSTPRPSDTRQTTGFRYTPGVDNTTGRLHASAQPTSQADASHHPTSNEETTASEVSASSQSLFPWQRRDEALDTKESSSVVGASHPSSSLLSPPSSLGYRKNKPVAAQWSLLGEIGGGNQTIVRGNWTHPLEPLDSEDSSGSPSLVYDLTEFVEKGDSFLYEFDAAYSLEKPATISPAFISPHANNQLSSNQPDSRGTLLPVARPSGASEGRREHLLTEADLHNDSERLIAADRLPLSYSQDGLNPEAVTVSQTLTGAPTHHWVSRRNPSSQATTQLLQAPTFQPSLIIRPPALVINPTPSLPVIRLRFSTFPSEESLPKHTFSSSVPQKEEVTLMSESSLASPPLNRMHEADIAERLFNNLDSTDLLILHRSSISSPKTSSNTFMFSPSSALGLTPPSASLAFLSASTPFPSSQSSINLSAPLLSSPSTVALQVPTPPSLYTSYTLPPPLVSPVWSTTIPLPPSSPQQSNQRLSQTDGVVEPGHVPESDGVSADFQASLFLSLSSNLQREYVETASLLSLSLFSKAPSDSQMPVPEKPALSPETSTDSLSGPVGNQLSPPVDDQFPDTQSDVVAEPFEIVIDSSFNQINATPSGVSVESFSSVMLTPDLPAQMRPSLASLELSVVLQPSSNAGGLTVSHPDERYLSNIYPLPHTSHPLSQSDSDFTSVPAAAVWAFQPTRALLRVNTDGSQDFHSASLSATSSSSEPLLSTRSPLPLYLDGVSLTASSESLPADVTEPAESFMSLSLNAVTEKSGAFSSGSQDRHTSSLTSNRVQWSQLTVSPLHADNQVNTATGAGSIPSSSQALLGQDSAFNHPTPPLSNPSVTVPTQTLAPYSSPSAQLGTTTPPRASGLDYMHHLCSTQTNSEPPRHTHNSLSQSSQATAAVLDASEELGIHEMPGHETPYAEAQDDAGGLQKQLSHLMSSALTPLLLSSSSVSSLSPAATSTPQIPSLQLSSVYPEVHPSISISPHSLSPFISPPLSPVRASWVPLQPAVAASVAEAAIGPLSPTRATAGFDQSATTPPPMGSYSQSFQRLTTIHISQSTPSMQTFGLDRQSLPLLQASSLPDHRSDHSQSLDSDELRDKDELLPQLAKNSETVDASRFVTGPRLSPEISVNLTAARKQPHPSALFDPADVVPKIHSVNEHESDAAQPHSVDVMLNVPNESLNPKAGLNTPLSLPTAAVSTQPTADLVISTPLDTSGLNLFSTPASGSPSSNDALNHGIVSGLAELPPPGNHTTHPAGLKYISTTTETTRKDSPPVPAEMTDAAKAGNAPTLIEDGSVGASQGGVTDSSPTADLSLSKTSLNSSVSVLNHSWSQSSGVSGAVNPDYNNVKAVHLSTAQPVGVDARFYTTTKRSPTSPFKAVSGGSGGLKKATARTTPGSPPVALTSRPALPCQCKHRFHFTCLCGLSTGNSM